MGVIQALCVVYMLVLFVYRGICGLCVCVYVGSVRVCCVCALCMHVEGVCDTWCLCVLCLWHVYVNVMVTTHSLSTQEVAVALD